MSAEGIRLNPVSLVHLPKGEFVYSIQTNQLDKQEIFSPLRVDVISGLNFELYNRKLFFACRYDQPSGYQRRLKARIVGMHKGETTLSLPHECNLSNAVSTRLCVTSTIFGSGGDREGECLYWRYSPTEAFAAPALYVCTPISSLEFWVDMKTDGLQTSMSWFLGVYGDYPV